MAPCEGLQQIFQNPPPENPSLLESLTSWKPLRSVRSIDRSYTELFGELHFRESSETSLPSALVSEAAASWSWSSGLANLEQYKKDDGITPYSSHSMMNSESLHLCTEGLGFESLDGVEDTKSESSGELSGVVSCTDKAAFGRGRSDQYKTAKSCGGLCPPPISSVGRTGNSWVSFKSYREDGRFVLEEVRIPTQDYLHASREDGRLKLCLVEPHVGEDEDEHENE